jgi:hypothetical protein
MRFLVSVFLALSVAIGADGEGVAPCPNGCCGGLEGPCQCGHEDSNGQNDIPAIPQMPCYTTCASHAAGSLATLDNSEIKVTQKLSGKSGDEKPNPHFAPLYLSKIAARNQPIIEHLNLQLVPPGPAPSFEKLSTRLALLSTFRK